MSDIKFKVVDGDLDDKASAVTLRLATAGGRK